MALGMRQNEYSTHAVMGMNGPYFVNRFLGVVKTTPTYITTLFLLHFFSLALLFMLIFRIKYTIQKSSFWHFQTIHFFNGIKKVIGYEKSTLLIE